MAAEVQALISGAETAYYLSKLVSQVMNCRTIKTHCYTDNKCIVTALDSTKQIDNKRLRLDILVLKDMIRKGNISKISWVKADDQLADCLTKRGVNTANLRKQLSRN